MNINELMSMPLYKMREWMKEHYVDPRGYMKNQYWYCYMSECFKDLEFNEESEWRDIPTMVGFMSSRDTKSVLDDIKYNHFHTLQFSIAKISKYGECVIFTFEGSLEHTSKTLRCYDDYWSFILDKVTMNNNNDLCRCYVDGKDIINNSQLVGEFELHSGDYSDNWVKEKYSFELDEHYSLPFKDKPILSSLSKNKHSIKEFTDKLEKFSSKVSDIGNKVYYENKDIVNNTDFKKKCKSVHISPNEIFDLWIYLYVNNQDVTIDDIIGMIRLSESTENHILEYVSKCKAQQIRKDYNNKYSLNYYSYNHYRAYNLVPLFGKITYTNVVNYLGYIKKLDVTREYYNSLDTYKDTIKYAKTSYKVGYKILAQEFENKIRQAYEKIHNDILLARDEYLKSTKNLYNEIHEKYQGVNDSDVGIFETYEDIISNIEKDFEKTAVKLMRDLDSNYKKKETKNKEKVEKNYTEFKEHCKKLFDVSKDTDKLVYYSVHKSYDAPYEIFEGDDSLEDFISEDAIYDYEEKYGQGSFDEWMDKFYSLCPGGSSDYRSLGDSLYPGCKYIEYINRNLEFNEEDNVD